MVSDKIFAMAVKLNTIKKQLHKMHSQDVSIEDQEYNMLENQIEEIRLALKRITVHGELEFGKKDAAAGAKSK